MQPGSAGAIATDGSTIADMAGLITAAAIAIMLVASLIPRVTGGDFIEQACFAITWAALAVAAVSAVWMWLV